MTKDYYETLGVGEGATEEEIRKAYKKKAQKHHPDRGGDEEQFKELQEANNVLSDKRRRGRYDNGEDVSQREPTPEEAAISQLAHLFASLLEGAEDHIDLILAARQSVEKQIFNAQHNIRTGEEAIKKVRHLQDRVRYKGHATDVFHSLTDARIAKTRETLTGLEKNLTILKLLPPMLNDYECKVTTPTAFSGSTTYSGIFNTTTC